LAFGRELRKRKFDLGVILPNSLGSALQFTLGRVKFRLGYFKEGRRMLLHAGRARDHDASGKFVPKYTGQYFMDLLDEIGLPPGPMKPTLPVTQAEREAAQNALRERNLEGGPLVIIAPGAAFGPSKLWPAERFAAVGDALAAEGAKVLLSFGPGEEATIEAVQKAAKQSFATTAGVTLGTLKAVYERAALVLTNDTGPRHVALALGRPVVCIMGPNDPRYSELAGATHHRVIREPVDCPPWQWPCQLKECPIDHRCMNGIGVERVLGESRAMMSGGQAGSR
jgi:heptosyltransferase-2